MVIYLLSPGLESSDKYRLDHFIQDTKKLWQEEIKR